MDKIERPLVTLQPMVDTEYGDWLRYLAEGYASDNVTAKYWPAVGAVERAINEIQSLLPQGLQTEGHYLFTISVCMTDEKVGYLWVRVSDDPPEKRGFILDLEIKQQSRRKGYAGAAMRALEEEAKTWGLARLSLFVFKHNTAAVTLYEKLGFSISGYNMTKEL